MRSCNSDTLGYKFYDRTDKQTKLNTLLCLLQDPDIQKSLQSIFETFMATSELKVLKRLSHLEELLGVDDTIEDSSIPSRLSKLEERMEHTTCEFKPIVEPPIEPVTKTEKRAFALVNYLHKKKRRFLNSSEIVHFLKHDINEECKVQEMQKNIRQTKKEVLEKAVELFPDIQLNKSTHGRHEVRLVLT